MKDDGEDYFRKLLQLFRYLDVWGRHPNLKTTLMTLKPSSTYHTDFRNVYIFQNFIILVLPSSDNSFLFLFIVYSN